MTDLQERHAEGDRHLAAQAAHVRHLIETHGHNADCTCAESGYRCVAVRLFEDLRQLPADSLADVLVGVILTRAMSAGGAS